jgi:hypothetical protein
MNNFEAYDPSSIGQAIIGSVFYISIAFVVLLSLVTLYVFLKRTIERPLSLTVTIVYLMIFLAVVGQGINTLGNIR